MTQRGRHEKPRAGNQKKKERLPSVSRLKTKEMILYKESAALKKRIAEIKKSGKTIGFVPTMGALHAGHVSLIKKSKSICDITICSIFVNPTQFNDVNDFEKYPVTTGNDILLLEKNGCDILFLPAVSEIYPEGTHGKVHYDLGEIECLLEGKYRPEHYQGVCQVVHKLLIIATPDYLFLGQKDYQQCLVIKHLVQLLNLPVNVMMVCTFREPSGLAASSRNVRLSEDQKQKATSVSKMLLYIKNNYTIRPVLYLENFAADYLLHNGFSAVDYVSIADADTLQPADNITESDRLVALIAAFIGDVRLIDNVLLTD